MIFQVLENAEFLLDRHSSLFYALMRISEFVGHNLFLEQLYIHFHTEICYRDPKLIVVKIFIVLKHILLLFTPRVVTASDMFGCFVKITMVKIWRKW